MGANRAAMSRLKTQKGVRGKDALALEFYHNQRVVSPVPNIQRRMLQNMPPRTCTCTLRRFSSCIISIENPPSVKLK